MTTSSDVQTTHYRLHPGPLAYPWFRRTLLGGWLAGAAVIWWDAATGPFTALLFVPAVLLCLCIASTLLWSYRHILFHFAAGLDERETALRARVFQTALAITAVSIVVVWGWTFLVARADNGWHLKEVTYLLPLALMAAPGAAATFTLPTDD